MYDIGMMQIRILSKLVKFNKSSVYTLEIIIKIYKTKLVSVDIVLLVFIKVVLINYRNIERL